MQANKPAGQPIGGQLVQIQKQLTERAEALISEVGDCIRWTRERDDKKCDHYPNQKGMVFIGKLNPGRSEHGCNTASDFSPTTPFAKLVSKSEPPQADQAGASPTDGVESFYFHKKNHGVSFRRDGDKEIYSEWTFHSAFLTVTHDRSNGTLSINDPLLSLANR